MAKGKKGKKGGKKAAKRRKMPTTKMNTSKKLKSGFPKHIFVRNLHRMARIAHANKITIPR